MARARNIKPGFFKNEDLAECTPWARLCFAGLWTLADREGRLEDRPKRIKGELFPYDTVDVEPLLQELERFKFILRYEIDGFKAIQILEFAKHQSPHYSEVQSVIKPPTLPEPRGNDDRGVLGELPESLFHDEPSNPDNSRSRTVIKRGSQPPDSLIPDSLIPKTPLPPKGVGWAKPDWIPDEPWSAFEEMRRKRKKPLTDRARTLAVGKLEALRSGGHDVQAVIEQTVLHAWDTFYPLKAPQMNGHDTGPANPWEGAK